MSLREHCIKILLKSDSVRFMQSRCFCQRFSHWANENEPLSTANSAQSVLLLTTDGRTSEIWPDKVMTHVPNDDKWRQFIPLVWLRACAFPTSTFLVSPVHSHPSLGHLTWQERMFLSVALSGNMSWMKTKHHPIEQSPFTKIGLIFYSLLIQDPFSLTWYRFIAKIIFPWLYHRN